ncbi:MAG: LPS-assembly protein LptD [Treponema sp.]|jgi:lipopolysaccharide assembly outer membrane protein LptD (OstA)|nr:LPS-assembly protein LptD [Treponema sp.]
MRSRVALDILILAFILFLSLGYTLNAQEAPDAGGETPIPVPEAPDAGGGTPIPVPEAPAPSQEAQVLEMDIKTSTLQELAIWCRSLGLSEGGTREELANRLRTYYKLSMPDAGGEADAPEGTKKPRIITIESARSTEYFTLDVVEEDYARLKGGVILTLKDGDAIHRISAGEILYNRTRNMISASGGVEYVKQDGDTIETFKGEAITVNLDSWSSIFMEGITERSLSDNNTSYRFEGTVISRSDEEATSLRGAKITNATNEEAYWSLSASKLWLLPGSDWAILNAVLKVGEIPVLYLPFFYFPADEIIFHPVLGYRSREGNFVQTTTYILGRPKASTTSESSISKILGNSENMEKTHHGVFLRSTGHKSTDPNDTRLSMLLDAYANLGYYLGTELTLPKKGILSSLDLSTGIGFTRDIYQVSSGYTPFAQYDGTSDWNTARFFDKDIPFRYRFNTKGGLAVKKFSMNWVFPHYSDPYVDRDFVNYRSEEMDWVNMLKSTSTNEEETTTETLLGSYDWRLNSSFTPAIPLLAPYISTLSLASFTSSVAFRTRTSVAITNTVSPNRTFFYPDKFTIYSISTVIAGTPLTLGNVKTTTPKEEDKTAEDPLAGIGTPRSPWEQPPDTETDTKTGTELAFPALSQRFDLPKSGGPRFTFDYRFTPSSSSELQFRSSQINWPEVEEIDWSEISSILTTFRSDGSFTLSVTQPETSLYTTSLKFSGIAAWQDHTHINEEAEEYTNGTGENKVTDQTKIDAAHERAYTATYFTTSYESSTTIKPLYRNAIWGNSSLQYTLKGLLVKNEFTGTGADPSWEVIQGEWNKDDIEIHQVATNFAASVMDKVQTLTITADIPPEDITLAGNATFRVWRTETNIRGKLLDPFDEHQFDPIYFTETLRFGTNNSWSLQQYVVYDPKIEEFTNFTTTFGWSGLSASYTATHSRPYILEPQGWIQSTEDAHLNPVEFKIAYSKTFKKASLWNKRLSFSITVNSNFTFDLQRYTNSSFNNTFGFTLGIANFLDISFSTTSANTVVFRYFQNLPFFELPIELPGEQNFFTDLFNSFRFDDESLRKSSGFKLKAFKIDLVHHLGDWNAKLGITLTPYLDQNTGGVPIYRFNNVISFVVQWVPITEIKTEITHDKDKIVFK